MLRDQTPVTMADLEGLNYYFHKLKTAPEDQESENNV